MSHGLSASPSVLRLQQSASRYRLAARLADAGEANYKSNEACNPPICISSAPRGFWSFHRNEALCDPRHLSYPIQTADRLISVQHVHQRPNGLPDESDDPPALSNGLGMPMPCSYLKRSSHPVDVPGVGRFPHPLNLPHTPARPPSTPARTSTARLQNLNETLTRPCQGISSFRPPGAPTHRTAVGPHVLSSAGSRVSGREGLPARQAAHRAPATNHPKTWSPIRSPLQSRYHD